MSFGALTRRRIDGAPDRSHAPWVIAATLALSLVFGLLAGLSPKYAIGGVIAIGFVVLALTDLVAAFAVFTAITFLETLSSGSTASVDKLAGLLIVFVWIIRLSSRPDGEARTTLRENRVLFVWLALYLALNLVSAAWSTSTGPAIAQWYRYSLDMLLIPIIYSIVESERDLLKLIVGYLVGAAISVVYGFIDPVANSANQAGRLTGTIGDANQAATVLVAAIALCAGLWVISRRSPRLRLLVVGVGVLSVVGLVGTLSRAGLLAMGVVLLLATIVGGPARRAAAWACVVVLVAAPTYFVFFAGHRAHRVDSTQSSGRNDIWLVAWREWEDHPVLGVGAGNFEVVSPQYLDRPGLLTSAGLFVYNDIVVHNIYLEQLATLGPLGLILLLGAFAAMLTTGFRAARIYERLGDDELEILSRFWILAVAAFLTAYFFDSELVDKQLWIVGGLGPALLKLARGQLAARSADPDASAPMTAPQAVHALAR